MLKMISIIAFVLIIMMSHNQPAQSAIDSRSHLVKITTTIMIENDGNTPITHHLIDCDERNGHSRLSHIVAKLKSEPMPVSKTDDGKMWRIDLSSRPIEPGATTPLMVTKVYTHLELVPAHDVYLMPYSSIQYQVRIIKQGRPQKVKVPSEQYYLVVDDKALVDLEESTSTALALESEGSTKIRFVDKSVISDEDFIQPESTIHIVNPSYLTMHVTPGDSWALQKFTDYTLEIRIFDAHGHQIHPSDNLDIQLTSGNEILVTNSTSNGTYHSIHTLNSGPSKLVARLMGTSPTLYGFEKPSQEIELIQDLNIYEPLDIKPTAIVLPWLPESKPSYQVSIYAAGGTGSYRWSSNNTALTDISYGDDDSSVAKISTLGEGTALIQCTDTKSPVFLRHSMVVVSRIVELSVLPSITETELDGDILLPVAVYANVSSLLELHLSEDEIESDLVLFHDCSKVKFDVEIVEKTRFAHDPAEILPNMRPKSCASLRFTCTQPGSSRIWITYSDATDPTSKPIKTTTVIACYKPLRPVYPEDIGVLALHTSIELAFEGGPRPFGSRIDDHFSHIEPSGDPILRLEPIIDRYRFNKDLHVFKAHCNEYGEVTLNLDVGNQPSATLPNPASSRASIKIICAKPDSIQLRPRLKETCPLNEMASLSDTIVPISASSPTDFDLVVFDDSKRPFLNISSFSIKWTLSGQGNIGPKQVEEVNAVAGFRKITKNYITLLPTGNEGNGRLQAELSQYKNQGLYRGQTLDDMIASLEIQFVDDAQISPNRTLLYNHKKNVVVLSIKKGSGYFSVESLQGAKHANVSYVSVFGQHRINITPLGIGKFVVRLEDQCIDTKSGLPILSEVGIVSENEFSKEALLPGRSMKYCRDVDESMFCLYLSVDRATVKPLSTTPRPFTPSVAPITQRPTLSTTNDNIASKQPPASQVQSSPRPASVEPIRPSSRTESSRQTTTQAPKLIFDDAAQASTGPSTKTSPSTLFQVFLGYTIMLFVTASAITLGYKWWQEKGKRQTNTQFVTDSSFLRQSPTHGAGVRFSPSTSRSGPSSSTPRSRPLYTERFSTTLLSD